MPSARDNAPFIDLTFLNEKHSMRGVGSAPYS